MCNKALQMEKSRGNRKNHESVCGKIAERITLLRIALQKYNSEQLNQMYMDTYNGHYESISTFTDPNFVKKCFAASPRFIGTPSFCSRESVVCNEATFFFLSRRI